MADTFLAMLQADFPIAGLIFPGEGPMSLGHFILHQWGFPSEYWWVWVCVGAMVVCTVVFNLTGYLAHAYLPRMPPGAPVLAPWHPLFECPTAFNMLCLIPVGSPV